jgi:ribosome biogenesis GTPase
MPRGRDVHRLDEDDVRVRANPRGTRPRSKQRPSHTDAAEGMVLSVDRGRYGVLVGDAVVTAMRARELGRKGIAVGDRVDVVGDLSGRTDALARIVRLAERSTVLRRTADDFEPVWGSPRDQRGRVIVANADQLVIVAALADPPPSYGLIDRCIVAALTAGLEPLICWTKSDLAAADEALARYEALSVPAVITRAGGPLDELRDRLRDQISVFVGHSGVGKSTLINALVPDADRATGVVSAIGKGRHTSSSAVALRLPGPSGTGGWVIDTPGVRSFGLAHVTAEDLLWAFPDLEDGATGCPPGCEHLSAEVGCTLDAWVAAGHATAERLAAFRRLLTSRASG